MTVESNVKWFGAMDRVRGNEGGDIKNTYPAWYFTNKLEEMRDDVNDVQARLRAAEDMGNFMGSDIPKLKAELRNKTAQLERIELSMPKPSAKDMDRINKAHKDLENQIADSMPTRTDMMRGTTSAHQEAKMMSEPCIKVPHGAAMDLQAMGINASRGGMISRNEATRAWKIMGRLKGVETNVETLRKDRKTGTYESHRTLEEMERD